MVLHSLECADRSTEAKEVAVDAQRHGAGVVTPHVGPTREELPLFTDNLPIEGDWRDGGAVHPFEMHAVGSVLGHHLRMYRLASRSVHEDRVGRVIGTWVGFELRERQEDVGHGPRRCETVWLMP